MNRVDQHTLTFTAWGLAAGQGKMRATRTGKVYDASKGLMTWRRKVSAEAVEQTVTWALANGRQWEALDCPVAVAIRFVMPRPAGHYGTGRNADQLRPDAPRYPITNSAGPTSVPDIDHQLRAVLDALKIAGIYVDDSRVVKVIVEQTYAAVPQGARAIVTVRPHDPPLEPVTVPPRANQLPVEVTL